MDTTRITLKHYMDTTWINIKNKWKTSERSQLQMATYCMVLFIWNVQNKQICRQKAEY